VAFFEIIIRYIQLGFTHVIPLGFDHILFIISIYFLTSNIKSVIIQCSVFTIAHSFSLAITAAGFIVPDTRIIEPLIAFSILITSIGNIVQVKKNTYQLLLIFIFGLIHGMGFARALNEIGIPPNNFLSALFAFNIGVELGQITVILLVYMLVVKWLSTKKWYEARIVYPISCAIGCIALYWTIERIIH